MSDEPKPPGTVITFYSYKGGVGRSMAVANVAALLLDSQLGSHASQTTTILTSTNAVVGTILWLTGNI